MKAAILSAAFVSLSFAGLAAHAQSCTGGGGNHAAPGYPYPSNYPTSFGSTLPGGLPTAADVTKLLNGGGAAASPTTPSAPAARITVVDSAPSGNFASSTSTSPTARISVVGEGPSIDAAPATEVAATKPAPVENEKIDAALAGLVGTWKAVARHGDGELTTVELQLDDRGWAKLTVPATDGTKSTIKRRIELKNDELKLTGPDAELLLGKLVSSSAHQLVLDRAGSQVTFVRP